MSVKAESIINEIEKVIVGKRDIIEKVLMAILAKGHVLLDDVPGVGKTTMALTISKVLGLDYKRVQFTPDVVPSDIIGFSIYNKNSGEFEFKKGAVMTNLLLADEINRTSSKTQSALLEVMEEGQVTVDGKTYPLPEPFIVIATQNPVGSAGTQLLPQSQLDRFMIKMEMGYPDYESQVDILRDRLYENPIKNVKCIINPGEIKEMQEEVNKVSVDDRILRYITDLAVATRKNPLIKLGLSPRGTIAIVRMSRAHGYIKGRDYVLPEDVQAVFTETASHRVILNPKAKIEGTDAETLMHQIIRDTDAPDSGR